MWRMQSLHHAGALLHVMITCTASHLTEYMNNALFSIYTCSQYNTLFVLQPVVAACSCKRHLHLGKHESCAPYLLGATHATEPPPLIVQGALLMLPLLTTRLPAGDSLTGFPSWYLPEVPSFAVRAA